MSIAIIHPRHSGGNMGRPTFTIDGQRLKELREGAGKTQLSIAKETHAKLGITHPSTDKTLESDYQRIERTGRTSRPRAEALAEILGITVEVLQGKCVPEPVDYVAGIAERLKERFLAPGNDMLVHALEGTSEPSDGAMRQLAEVVSERIESAQLARNPADLAELTELTGMPESELLKPANVQGYWLVVANGACDRRTQLVRGTSDLVWHLREIAGDLLNAPGSDGSVRMFRDGPWFRVEIRPRANPNTHFRFDFVRCAPIDDKGIRWIKATLREFFDIQISFKRWAYSASNFVTDFEGRHSPFGDVRRLRLLVTKHEGTWHPTGRMVVYGDLDKINDEIVEQFRRGNSVHAFVQERLIRDLKQSLAPLLAEYPQTCWSVRKNAGRVALDLDETKTRKRPIQDCHFGMKYRIDLIEEVGEREFTPVPWRDTDVDQLQDEIKEMLSDSNGRSWASNDPRRAFELYTEEE